MLIKKVTFDEKYEIIRYLLIQVKDLKKIIELEEGYPDTLKNINLDNIDDNSFIEIFDFELYIYLIKFFWIIEYDEYNKCGLIELKMIIEFINKKILSLETLLNETGDLNIKKRIEKLKFQRDDVSCMVKEKEKIKGKKC